MKTLLATLVMLSMIAGLSAAASYDVCWPQYVSCSDRCCTNAGGSFSEESDGVYCDASDSELVQYYACDTLCVRQELNCLAPGSSCAQMYTSCTNDCGGPSGDSCNGACSDDAFDCADEAARNPAPSPGTDSSCCGSAMVLLFAAAGAGLLFARGS